MITHYNIQIGEIYPQPGFNPKQDQNNTWTASRDYAMLRATWEQGQTRTKFAIGNIITNLDSEVSNGWSFLTITEKELVHEEAEHIVIRVTFNGSQPIGFDGTTTQDGNPPTYRLEGRLAELSLSQHPKWKALSDDEQLALGKLLRGEYRWGPDPFADPYPGSNGTYVFRQETLVFISPDPIQSNDAKLFAEYIASGKTTYVVPSVVYIETQTGPDDMTPAQLNLLGKISNPRGNPPTPSGNRNWMLTGASQEQRGKIYQTQFEWTLSEREGWDEFLYDD
jgi:hypothetical protein